MAQAAPAAAAVRGARVHVAPPREDEGTAKTHPDLAARAMSEAGSNFSDRMESAALAAAELMRLPLRCVVAGAAFVIVPTVLLVLAPLIILIYPLLFPFGCMLVLLGAMRAAYIILVSRELDTSVSLFSLTSAMTSFDEHAQGRSLRTPDASPKPDRHRTKLSRKPPQSRNAVETPEEVRRERRATDGTLEELKGLAATRGETMVKQLSSVLKNNVGRVAKDVAVEIEQQLRALQHDLQSWAGVNPNLKPYASGFIGWLLKEEALEQGMPDPTKLDHHHADKGRSAINSRAAKRQKHMAHLNLTPEFERLLSCLPPAETPLCERDLDLLPLPEGVQWGELGYLLIPGLLTKWYPLYMGQLRADMKRLGLHVQFSRIDTDQPVRVNAARLMHEVFEIYQTGRRVVLLGHSKGAVDAAAALSIFPELADAVAALVSLQGPHGGSAIAHDLVHTNIQKSITLGAIEKLLRGCRHAVLDLSFHSRQEFLRRHPYPRHRVPTLCVATCDRRPSSLLKPTIDYLAVRYGEYSDGCVCQADAILPHCPRVLLDDMDHFGPAWPSFPATDRYDPARLWLTCVSLALRHQPQPLPVTCNSTSPASEISKTTAPMSGVIATGMPLTCPVVAADSSSMPADGNLAVDMPCECIHGTGVVAVATALPEAEPVSNLVDSVAHGQLLQNDAPPKTSCIDATPPDVIPS